MKRTIKSLRTIDYHLFFSLIILGLCPTLYTTLRIFFLGQLPGEYAYSIAGQLSWVNLLYEILNEAIILPLFFFIGQVVKDKDEFQNRIRSGLIVSFIVYLTFSLLVIIFAEPLLYLMAASPDIVADSVSYIRIQSVANVFAILAQFLLVALVTLGKDKIVYALTFARLILSILTDTFLVSNLPISLNLGVNGIGYSNIIVNIALFAVSVAILKREDCEVFGKGKMSFFWMKEFGKVGAISGIESFVRNIAYMLMIARMVNVVSEQGTYWVANNFIWGWLLLPVTQLGELIKQNVATDPRSVKEKTSGYVALTSIICLVWIVTVPLWKPFMRDVLMLSDVDNIFNLVVLLVGFYILYAFQNVFDATFYGAGKTNYMLWESVVTNTIYYGVAFVLYLNGVWTPTLNGIALLFGVGMAFDAVVSLVAYIVFRKRFESLEQD